MFVCFLCETEVPASEVRFGLRNRPMCPLCMADYGDERVDRPTWGYVPCEDGMAPELGEDDEAEGEE